MKTRNDLRSCLRTIPRLARLHAEVRRRVDDDPGHDLGHLERVALWTARLGGAEVDRDEAVAAGLLHDLINIPKDSPDRAKASERSAEAARGLLEGFDADAIARICEAIRDHSFSRGARPTAPLARALQDADRLEALGAIGVMRCISCGSRMGASYFHPEDPLARSRALDDRAWSIDHFFAKLLTLEGTMTTDAGRAEARRRTEFLRGFLAQLGDELGDPPPTSSGV